MLAAGISLSHSVIGKSGSQVAMPARRWFLYVRIARSAALILCMWGGVSWKVCLAFTIAFFNAVDASLSIIQKVVVCPFLVMELNNDCHVLVSSLGCLVFKVSAKIMLES